MGILFEILRALIYTTIGGFAGYQFCKMRLGVEEIKEKFVAEDPESIPEAPPEETEEDRLFSDRQSRIIGLVVLLITIFSLAQSVYFTAENRNKTKHDSQVTQCQADFNTDFARVLTIRGQYADEDRNLLNTMIFTIITETDEAKRAAAVQTWVKETQENDRLRKQNPIPSLAARNCEEQ